MSPSSPRLHELCILATGGIRANYDPASPAPEDWVYQRRARGKGNIHRDHGPELQLRRKGIRHDRLTSKNQTRRALFAEAVAAWKTLAEPEKNAYRERAVKLPATGYNLFIREHQEHNMATLDQRISDLATAIGTAINGIETAIGNLEALDTDAKGTLVAAINEVHTAAGAINIPDHDYVADFEAALNPP